VCHSPPQSSLSHVVLRCAAAFPEMTALGIASWTDSPCKRERASRGTHVGLPERSRELVFSRPCHRDTYVRRLSYSPENLREISRIAGYGDPIYPSTTSSFSTVLDCSSRRSRNSAHRYRVFQPWFWKKSFITRRFNEIGLSPYINLVSFSMSRKLNLFFSMETISFIKFCRAYICRYVNVI